MKKYNDIFLIIIAIFIGIIVSLIASFYAFLLNFIEFNLLEKFIDSQFIIIIPAIGGLLVGLLLENNAMSARGHGIPAILQTIKTKEVHFSFHDLLIEGFASVITIGTGGSAGRIGPVVEIGAGLSDLIDKKLDFPFSVYKTILGCGAAAGISAIFHAPLGGIAFVMEIIFRDLELKKLTLVIISALSANIFVENIFNLDPLFDLPAFTINSSLEYLFFLILGIILGLIGYVFVKSLYSFSTFFDNLDIPLWLKPTIGGLIVGITGFFLKEILGTGINISNYILKNNFPLKLLILIMILKIFMTSITLGSGGSGGVFTPILMIGSITGVVFAELSRLFFNNIIGLNISYGVIGMAAAFAGISQAPFSAAIIIFELTGNYHIIVPLLLASVMATTIYNRFMKESVYSPDLFKRLGK